MHHIRDDERNRILRAAGKGAASFVRPFTHFARVLWLSIWLATLPSANVALAVSVSPTVAFAGFAYAGDFSNFDTRFKYSKRYERSLLATGVVISNSCPILQQLMSNAVALKPVLPIFQVLGLRITHIPLQFWTSIADKGHFLTENADMFSAQLAA
jgi:hypothetical protein